MILEKFLMMLKKKKKRKILILEVDKDKPLKGKLIIQMYEKQSSRTRLKLFILLLIN